MTVIRRPARPKLLIPIATVDRVVRPRGKRPTWENLRAQVEAEFRRFGVVNRSEPR